MNEAELASFMPKGARGTNDVVLWPLCTSWPMGFSWSSYLAQSTLLTQCNQVNLSEGRMLSDDLLPPRDGLLRFALWCWLPVAVCAAPRKHMMDAVAQWRLSLAAKSRAYPPCLAEPSGKTQ